MDQLVVFLLLLLLGLAQRHVAYASSCGTQTFSGKTSGYVQSASNYENNMNCIYDIRVPSGYGVKLDWITFDVKGSMPYCSGDYIEVYIGCSRRSIGKYCSDNLLNSEPHMMFSHDSCMRIKFHSDGSKTGMGFKARFTTFSQNSQLVGSESSCSSMDSRYTTAGDIHSPKWPLQYPYKKDCHWKIKVGDDHGIKIAFMDFNIRSDIGCDDDKIKIKGGDVQKSYDKSSTVKDSMCGTKSPFSFTSTKDQIYIRFKSSSSSFLSSRKRGFVAGYVVYRKVASSGGSSSFAMVVAPIIAAMVLLGCCCFCWYKKRRAQMGQNHANATTVTYQTATAQPAHQPYPVSGGQNIAPPPPVSYGPAPGAIGAGYPYPPATQAGQAGPLPGKEGYPPPAYPPAQAPPPAYPAQGYPAPAPYPQQPAPQAYPPPGVPPFQAGPPPQTDAPAYPGGHFPPGEAPPYPSGPAPPGGVQPYPSGPPPPGGVAPYPTGPSAPPNF